MRFKVLKNLLILPISLSVAVCIGTYAGAEKQEFYGSIEETQNQKVVELTETMAERYAICPEILQALIFYESSNRSAVVSRWGDIGYMQINPRWQKERMEQLGVCDLTDGYGNVLVGTDYLMELCEKYGDISLALIAYNGGEAAVESASDSGMNEYSKRILELSEKLERLHGK